MPKNEECEERPPLFSSWRGLYAAVVLILVVQILLFWLFTGAFK